MVILLYLSLCVVQGTTIVSGELGRLMREDGIPLEEIQEIRFEYLQILKMDHLWVLKSLVKLQLNNNIIEKIENIESLVHLEELDLSFNNIGKIENLDTLVKLRKLVLYDNEIDMLENMDALKNLAIFSIGMNRIADEENVLYLRRFSKLMSLNMAQNPCTEKDDFRIFVGAFLPQVTYYEYKKIDDQERQKGMAMYEQALRIRAELEQQENAATVQLEQERADAERHSVSFVEYLNSGYLFNKLFEDDIEGKALLDMGEDMEEYYAEYETEFVDLCKQVFEVGQKHYKIRTDEIELFFKTVEAAKKENQEESIGYMEKFLDRKQEMFKQIQNIRDQYNHDALTDDAYNDKITDYSEEFNSVIHYTWKNLMKLELQLFEQLEDVNQNIERVLNEYINTFIEESQAIFSIIRALEVTYTDNLSDVATRYQTTANLSDEADVPESLQVIMSDKEALINAIATTHDMHLQIIDSREDTLMNRAKDWLETFVTTLTKDEIDRNRYKLLEINHFLDIQREEFDEMTADDTPAVDPDDLDLFIA